MSVQIETSQSIGAGKITARRQSLKHWLSSWLRLSCPDCGEAMEFRYELPEEFREVAPKYYECSCCRARYMRTSNGPWISAALPDCDFIYRAARRKN